MKSFYFANWTTGKKRSPLFATGHVRKVTDAVPLSRSIDSALFACAGWPVDVYEVKADSVSPDSAHETTVFVTSFRVLRLVSEEEVFGPCALELVAFLNELPQAPWLAPPRPPEEASLQRVVDAYYQCLSAYSPLDPAPTWIVRTWQQANALGMGMVCRGLTDYLSSLRRVKQTSWGTNERAFARKAMEVAVRHVAFLSVWEAAWRCASAAYVSNVAERGSDRVLASKQVEAVRAQFLAACEASPESAWRTTKRIGRALGRDLDETVSDDEEDRRAEEVRRLVTSIHHEVLPAWVEAFHFVQRALAESAAVAQSLIEPSELPTPSMALWEMYRSGVWPLGEHEGKFLVFAPPPAAT